MKRILITGLNSYIGTNVEKWLKKSPNKYSVHTLDMRNSDWKSFDLSGYDVVFHVAGIAHVSNKKRLSHLYFDVNSKLPIELAKKCKLSGVSHFVFMSSMVVYSYKETIINNLTVPKPDNIYGKSKLIAENELKYLQSESFFISIIRAPFIYGIHSKGNFNKLLFLSKIMFLLPKTKYKKSILYIDNLCIFVETIINQKKSALYYPTNRENLSTVEIIYILRTLQHKKTIYFRGLDYIFKILIKTFSIFRKIFGERIYDNTLINEEFKTLELVSTENSLAEIIDGLRRSKNEKSNF